jgi:SAM-dependent methyltransferase
MSSATPDFAAITAVQQQTWGMGDFNAIARTVVPVAESLVQAVDPLPRQRVLDLACGTGNTALVAARRYCDVTGLDFVPQLLERARHRAGAQGLRLELVVGDAQALPFGDQSFDCVLSTFGVMFAPDQNKAASEMLRVCKQGGRIGLACWTTQGFGADFFGAIAKYVPPPPGLSSPLRWGTREGLQQLLGPGVQLVSAEEKTVRIYYPSLAYAVESFRKWFGPIKRAFDLVGPARHHALAQDIAEVFQRYNRSDGEILGMDANYLQAVMLRT